MNNLECVSIPAGPVATDNLGGSVKIINKVEFDIVVESPIPPRTPVHLFDLSNGYPLWIGMFKSIEAANDAAYRAGTMRYGIKAAD